MSDIAALLNALGFLITAIIGAMNYFHGLKTTATLQVLKQQTNGIQAKLMADERSIGNTEGRAAHLAESKIKPTE
jgi:hypothetical protein